MSRPDRTRALRNWTLWAFDHGVSRHFLRRAARRGDLIAGLLVDDAVAADPFPTFERIRTSGPVHRGSLITGTVDHACANAILRSDDFGVAGGLGHLPPPARRLVLRLSDTDVPGPIEPPSLLALDPPDHNRIRRLVSRAFTSRAVSRLEDRVVEVADRLLHRLVVDGAREIDLVDAYASWLPVAVIADLLGIPEHEHARLLDLGNRAAVLLDPGLSWSTYHRAQVAVRELHDWFEIHLDRLTAAPGDDLLSALVTSEDVDHLTRLELRSLALLLLGAGFETTVNLIGNAVVQLDTHPDQRDRLLAEPDGWANAVEEVLRFDPPVQSTLRQAYVDTEVGGRTVSAGQGVVVILAGANRDPAVFTDPHLFDTTRPNADQHLSLSAGVHFCLGAGLARLETGVALRMLYDRFPGLHLTDATTRRTAGRGTTRRTTRILRGHTYLPVTLSATAPEVPRRPTETGISAHNE